MSEGWRPYASQLEPDRDLAADNGRAQTRGLRPLRGLLLSRRPFGRLANDTFRVFVFVLTDRCGDSADIEVVRLADVLSDPVQLVNDGIAPFHDELPTGSSSDVQMIPGLTSKSTDTFKRVLEH
jgi:hypothetical protein